MKLSLIELDLLIAQVEEGAKRHDDLSEHSKKMAEQYRKEAESLRNLRGRFWAITE